MKCYLKYFTFCFCLNFIEASFRCDYTYSNVSNGWFKYFDIPATWFDARLRCILEGAVLASPSTQEIKSDMIKFIKDSTLKRDIFTGIHATLSQGDYNTVEGTPLAKISVTWAKNEPDNKDNKESCTTFNSYGELADKPCDETRPYICYRPENHHVEANECGTVDSEYHLDTRTNKCYKFHMTPRNFSRASMACTAEGGHLAIINSEVEAKILSEIFSKVPRNEMLGMAPSWKEVAFVGFYDWNERGDWRTIHAYNFDKRTNKCYKFHTVPKKFSRAFMACSAEGGHLVIINSEVEAKVLKELFAKYPESEMVGDFRKDIAIIGVHESGEPWDFRTIYGETLEEAGFDIYANGEPHLNPKSDLDGCLGLYRTGLLTEWWSEKPLAFICEKDPSFPGLCRASIS